MSEDELVTELGIDVRPIQLIKSGKLTYKTQNSLRIKKSNLNFIYSNY